MEWDPRVSLHNEWAFGALLDKGRLFLIEQKTHRFSHNGRLAGRAVTRSGLDSLWLPICWGAVLINNETGQPPTAGAKSHRSTTMLRAHTQSSTEVKRAVLFDVVRLPLPSSSPVKRGSQSVPCSVPSTGSLECSYYFYSDSQASAGRGLISM